MNQKGGVGIPVIIAVIGGLVVFYIGYSFVGSLGNQDIKDVPITSNPATAQQQGAPSHAQAVVSFDNNIFTDGQSFYIQIPDGVDENGKQKYTYVKADIADAKTFHKVPVLGGTDSTTDTKGGKLPGFYMDSKHVYFFTGTGIEIVPGADPGTFQVLSPVYAKDANNVYVVHTTCDADGSCTGTVSIIPSADPGTFQTFHDTTEPNPDGKGTVTIDAKDDNNIYYYGTWIGPLPDPDDHSVHPQTDHPVLISP